MSKLSILGPPRGGRVVRDAREVIREIEQTKTLEGEVQTNIDSTSPKGQFFSSGKDSFGKYPLGEDLAKSFGLQSGDDIFEFSALVLTPKGDFKLIGLEVPEGRWEELTLTSYQLAGGHCLAHRAWKDFSLGYITQISSSEVYNDPPAEPMTRLIPLKAQYWFMRAAYELDAQGNGPAHANDMLYLLADELKNGRFFHADTVTALNQQHCSGTKYTLVHKIEGWPNGHPLNVTTELPFFPMMQVEVNTSGFEDTLYALLGDRNPARIKEVFGRVYKIGGPSIVYPIPNFPRPEPIPVIIGGDHDPVPSANIIMTSEPRLGFARGLIAEEKYFTPRGNKP